MQIIKSCKTALVLTVLSFFVASSASADLLGQWRTEKGPEGGFADLIVYKCKTSYCAKVSKAYGSAAVVPPGKMIIRNMGKSGNVYKGGQVYVSRLNKWVRVTITEKSASKAKVSACLGPICRSQSWSRIK